MRLEAPCKQRNPPPYFVRMKKKEIKQTSGSRSRLLRAKMLGVGMATSSDRFLSPGERRLDPVLASAWRRKDEVVRARASFEHFSDITTDEHHHLPQPSNSSVRHAANRQDRNQRHRLVRLFSRYAPAALLRCSGHAVSCLLNRLNRPAPTSLLRTRCLALFRARI